MTREPGEPTLREAWEMLGTRLGLIVEASSDDAIRATGTFRGRAVTVEIEGESSDSGMKGFLRTFRAPQRQGRAREVWNTRLVVSCANPLGLRGWVESAVDVNDPAWNPRQYDPAAGRVVRTEPAEMRDRIVSPTLRDKLMSIISDVRFELDAHELRFTDESATSKGSGFVATSPVHVPMGPVVPWPERALVSPPWWLDLMCDLADSIDALT